MIRRLKYASRTGFYYNSNSPYVAYRDSISGAYVDRPCLFPRTGHCAAPISALRHLPYRLCWCAVAADEYDQDTYAAGEGGVADDPPLAGWISCGAEFRRILDAIPARVVAATLGLLELDKRLLSLSVQRFDGPEDVAGVVLFAAASDSEEFETLPDDEELLASEGLKRLGSLMELRANVLLCWIIVIAVGTILGWMF